MLQTDLKKFFNLKKDSLIANYSGLNVMDMMLEEELIDLMTFCLQNPDSSEIR